MSQKVSRIVRVDVQWQLFSVAFYSVLCRVQEQEEKEEDIYGGTTDDEQEETTNKGISNEEMQGLGSAAIDQSLHKLQ